jgi:hypothetical protein
MIMVTDPNNTLEVRMNNGYQSLYALRNFRQGERILDLPTKVLTTPDKYSLEVIPGIHIDCGYSLAGSINHSCDANASVRGRSIIAWSCIKAGDQITLDYTKTEQKLAEPFDCNCGSKYCKGRIE